MDKDEYYPFYDADTEWSMGKEVEVPEHTYIYWTEVMRMFNDVQREMRQYYRGE